MFDHKDAKKDPQQTALHKPQSFRGTAAQPSTGIAKAANPPDGPSTTAHPNALTHTTEAQLEPSAGRTGQDL